MTGALATRLSGSSDIFHESGRNRTLSVNFIAAHDGFPLGDLVSFQNKHNEANGEDNRDGHGANYSWNNGMEGPTDDPAVKAARETDARALIASLFASRGTILLTAGDEFGHSQGGNNNAYAQDNAITWRHWDELNQGRLEFTRAWAELRSQSPLLTGTRFLKDSDGAAEPDQVSWLTTDGHPMQPVHWEDPERQGFMMVLGPPGERLTVVFNRGQSDIQCALPPTPGLWRPASPDASVEKAIPARSVVCWRETSG